MKLNLAAPTSQIETVRDDTLSDQLSGGKQTRETLPVAGLLNAANAPVEKCRKSIARLGSDGQVPKRARRVADHPAQASCALGLKTIGLVAATSTFYCSHVSLAASFSALRWATGRDL